MRCQRKWNRCVSGGLGPVAALGTVSPIVSDCPTFELSSIAKMMAKGLSNKISKGDIVIHCCLLCADHRVIYIYLRIRENQTEDERLRPNSKNGCAVVGCSFSLRYLFSSVYMLDTKTFFGLERLYSRSSTENQFCEELWASDFN